MFSLQVPPLADNNWGSVELPKVKEMKLIAFSNTHDLELEVNQALAEGWHLYGPVMPDSSGWAQTLVKYEG